MRIIDSVLRFVSKKFALAAVTGIMALPAHAGVVFTFENTPLGDFHAPSLDLGYGVKVGNKYADYPGFPVDDTLGTIKNYSSPCSGITCPAANTGHFFSTENSSSMYIYSKQTNVAITSLDVAVLETATFNGVAAADYMVLVHGDWIFPISSGTLVKAPSTGAFQFSNISLFDSKLSGLNGVTISVYACAKAGCKSGPQFSADGLGYRCEPLCGDANDFKKVAAAFDNVYISNVPEPQTYAMILAGLGLVGVSARRRQKSA